MKRPIIVALVLALAAVGALGASTWSTDYRQKFDIDGPISLDFGNAMITVVSWEQNHVEVTWPREQVKHGLRGHLEQQNNTLALHDFSPPEEAHETVRYSVGSWLPLLQFEEHRQHFIDWPEAHYTIYVPSDMVLTVKAGAMVIIGCRVAEVEGDFVRLSAVTLMEAFAAEAVEIYVDRSVATGSASFSALTSVVKDSQLKDASFNGLPLKTVVNVELRDVTAENVTIDSGDTPNLHAVVRDVVAETLTLIHDSELGSVVLQRSHIGHLNNQTRISIWH